MGKVTVQLEHGLKVGDDLLTEAEIREATAGDLIEAQEEAERLVYAMRDGRMEPTLVASPVRLGVEVLRRQIVRIGNMSGPIDLTQIKQLSPLDLNRLEGAARELENAREATDAPREVAQRGRGAANDSGA